MQSIRTVQVWGVLTKVGTTILSVAQTAIVLRLLGPESYGIVGIVVSLGALVGVSQHVGAVDAAIREIAVADSARRRATVFWLAMGFRLAITIPLSLVLTLLAPWIAERVYVLPDMVHLIRLMSVLLVAYGIQGILGGAYTGQRSFGQLYAFQLVMAVVNVPLFAWLVSVHGTRGYFEAAIIAAVLFSVLLALFVRRALDGPLTFPRWEEARAVLGDILHTGSWSYVARILSVAWQRIPFLLLGRWAAPEVVGLFSAAQSFGTGLQLLAAALGEVNLSFLSHAYARGKESFYDLARRTLEDVGAVTLLGAAGITVFADVLVRILAGPEYQAAGALVPLVVWAYALFSFLDIATNTVFVPARQTQLRAAAFGVLVAVSSLLLLRFPPTAHNAAWAVLIGALLALGIGEVLATFRMSLPLLPYRLFLPLGGALVVSLLTYMPLAARAVAFGALTLLTARVAFPRLTSAVVARLRG